MILWLNGAAQAWLDLAGSQGSPVLQKFGRIFLVCRTSLETISSKSLTGFQDFTFTGVFSVCETQFFCPHFAEVKNQTTCTKYIESTHSLWRAQYMVCKKFKKPSYCPSNLYMSAKLEVISENTHATHKKAIIKVSQSSNNKKRKLKGKQVTNPFWSCQVVTWGMFSQERQKWGSFLNEEQHSDLNKEGWMTNIQLLPAQKTFPRRGLIRCSHSGWLQTARLAVLTPSSHSWAPFLLQLM